MKHDKKLAALLLAAILMLTMLAGCDLNGGDDVSSSTDASDVTEETIPGYEGENGKPLKVDFMTHGTVSEDAPALDSRKIVIAGASYEFPCSVSHFTENGWHFYSDDIAEQSVSASTETNVMGFTLYAEEGRSSLEIDRLRNDASGKSAVKDCLVTKLTVSVVSDAGERLEFILPGGITERSTAADVIEVFGPAVDNTSFGYVQTGTSLLYYAEHETSDMSFAFHFSDDGAITGFVVIYES